MSTGRDLDIVVRGTPLNQAFSPLALLTTHSDSTVVARGSWKPTCFTKEECPETIIMISERVSAPKILLVDDEAQPLELRARIMKLHGFSVLTADGPMKALAMMAQAAIEKIQVAIVDYNMPGMNGYVLAQRLRSTFPELKTILYSGAIDIPSKEMTSVDAVISKGDGIGTLISQVMQFVQVSVDSSTRLPLRKSAYF
jgi:CheY-like chemotaxis protein